MARLMPLVAEEDTRPARYQGQHRRPGPLHRALDQVLGVVAALGEVLLAYALLAEDVKHPGPSEVWMLAYQDHARLVYVEHLGGVAWADAPLPRRWHRCRPQSRGWMGRYVEWCACGAIRFDPWGRWMDRNLPENRGGRKGPGSGAATGTPAPDSADTTYPTMPSGEAQ